MTRCSFRLLLGLAVVGAALSNMADRPLSSSASSDEKTEGEASQGTRHRRSAKIEMLTQDMRIAFLETHNRIRSDATGVLKYTQPPAARMMKMYWSAELEASAVAWSMTCPKQGAPNFPHGQTAMTKSKDFIAAVKAETDGWIGQNIEIAPYLTDAAKMVLGLGSETQFYTYIEGTAGGTCIDGEMCGHYTQVMWQNSYLVGCGYAKCGDNYFCTCNYSPGGNIKGVEIYKSGPPCSLCSADTTYGFTECEGQLCVPKDRCSPVTTCTVVDTTNCLCSESSYEEIVNRMVSGKSGAIHAGPLVIVYGLLLHLVVILLGHGVQLGYDDPGLPQQQL